MAEVEHIVQSFDFCRVPTLQVQRLQGLAVLEHGSHAIITTDIADIPSAEVAHGGQLLAAIEHFTHRRHLTGVERAQVEGLKVFAISKHALHPEVLRGVEILEAGDRGQVRHSREPEACAVGADVGKRRVDDHGRDIRIRAVRIPAGHSFNILVSQECGCVVERSARTRVSAAVAVERERGVASGVDGISLLACDIGKVAGGGCAAVDAGVDMADAACIIRRACLANQLGAAREHSFAIHAVCHSGIAPFVTHVDGGQVAAAVERITHEHHVPGVEGRQVERGQPSASLEHARYALVDTSGNKVAQVDVLEVVAVAEHVAQVNHSRSIEMGDIDFLEGAAGVEHAVHGGHFLGVEVAHIDGGEFLAVVEHALHAGHLAGVEVLQAGDVGQVRHAVEPVIVGRGPRTGKRRTDHDVGDACSGCIPAWVAAAGV